MPSAERRLGKSLMSLRDGRGINGEKIDITSVALETHRKIQSSFISRQEGQKPTLAKLRRRRFVG